MMMNDGGGDEVTMTEEDGRLVKDITANQRRGARQEVRGQGSTGGWRG